MPTVQTHGAGVDSVAWLAAVRHGSRAEAAGFNPARHFLAVSAMDRPGSP